MREYVLSRIRPSSSVKFAAVLAAPLMIFVGILPWPWSTLPGRGLSLTLNMLIWIAVAVISFALLTYPVIRRFRAGKIACWLLGGAALMSAPLAWTLPDAVLPSLYRIAGLWALAFLLILLLQFPVRGRLRRGILGVIVIAGLVQMCLGTWQIVFPVSAGEHLNYSFRAAHGRPLGSLMQVNLLGSFLATGGACAVWLFLSSRRVYPRVFWACCVIALCAGVVITESRTAWLAMYVTLVLMLLVFVRRSPGMCFVTAMVLGMGILAGQGILSLRPADLNDVTAISHSASPGDTRPSDVGERLEWSRQRSDPERMVMLIGTLGMIASHPFLGNGLSSFEVKFPEYIASEGRDNPFTVTVPFPHNEVLYVWSEGGGIALAGLLMWLWVWGTPFVRALRTRRFRMFLGRAALTLPVMVHIMLEYPLYQSAAHAILLIVLVWLAMPVQKRSIMPGTDIIRPLTFGFSVLCIVAVAFMVTGLQSARQIYDAERFALTDPAPLHRVMNPYAQPERLLFDKAVSALIQFNITQNYDWLSYFKIRAEEWLKYQNDANLIATMMQISSVNKDTTAVEFWRNRGCLSFPREPRFNCESAFVIQELNTP